jgi:hypothetical protein
VNFIHLQIYPFSIDFMCNTFHQPHYQLESNFAHWSTTTVNCRGASHSIDPTLQYPLQSFLVGLSYVCRRTCTLHPPPWSWWITLNPLKFTTTNLHPPPRSWWFW